MTSKHSPGAVGGTLPIAPLGLAIASDGVRIQEVRCQGQQGVANSFRDQVCASTNTSRSDAQYFCCSHFIFNIFENEL